MKRPVIVVAVFAALVTGACGARLDPETPAPTTGPSTTVPPAPPPDRGPAPGDAIAVEEALEADDGSEVTVTGALFVEDEVVRLCSALAESFPPQCGGASIVVEGSDLSEFELEEEQGIRWSDQPVELSGTISGGVLTVE